MFLLLMSVTRGQAKYQNLKSQILELDTMVDL